MFEFLLKKILSRVLNGDQVVWDVDRSLIGVLPLGSSKKLGIVFTEEVEHTEPGHVVEEDVLNNQKNIHSIYRQKLIRPLDLSPNHTKQILKRNIAKTFR